MHAFKYISITMLTTSKYDFVCNGDVTTGLCHMIWYQYNIEVIYDYAKMTETENLNFHLPVYVREIIRLMCAVIMYKVENCATTIFHAVALYNVSAHVTAVGRRGYDGTIWFYSKTI